MHHLPEPARRTAGRGTRRLLPRGLHRMSSARALQGGQPAPPKRIALSATCSARQRMFRMWHSRTTASACIKSLLPPGGACRLGRTPTDFGSFRAGRGRSPALPRASLCGVGSAAKRCCAGARLPRPGCGATRRSPRGRAERPGCRCDAGAPGLRYRADPALYRWPRFARSHATRSVAALSLYADACARQGRFAEALPALRQLVRLRRVTDDWQLLLYCEQSLGNVPQAVEALAKRCDHRPTVGKGPRAAGAVLSPARRPATRDLAPAPRPPRRTLTRQFPSWFPAFLFSRSRDSLWACGWGARKFVDRGTPRD